MRIEALLAFLLLAACAAPERFAPRDPPSWPARPAEPLRTEGGADFWRLR